MRGDGCYTECTVRKVPTMKDGALKGLLICAGLAVTLLGMVTLVSLLQEENGM